jgi:hypothetical protein
MLITPEDFRLATPRLPIAPDLAVALEGLQKGRLIGLRRKMQCIFHPLAGSLADPELFICNEYTSVIPDK